MKQLIYARSSGDDGGGYMAPSTGARSNNLLREVSNADIVVAITSDNEFKVIKNRISDQTGLVDNDTAIELVCQMISRMIFRERMLLFQESVKQRLVEKISTTIEMGGGEFIDTIQRACSSDGS